MSFYQKTGKAAESLNHRRTWDKTEYEIKANERAQRDKEQAEALKKGKKVKVLLPDGSKPPPPKKLLEARKEKVDLESVVGKQQVINKTSTTENTGGFYCDICDCIMKDSVNYLDHINGKNHQRNLGFTMKVKRSTVDDIRERLNMKKHERMSEKRKAEQNTEEDLKEEEAKLADLKRQRKEQKGKKKARMDEEEGEEPPVDDELMKMMGISGFGGSKKNN
uniref:Matrin-type domain-containing protein n=2 Tax=Bursaphelenchus xylophilus TaxID=6326 RepID=A0A1I7RWI2_BURXY